MLAFSSSVVILCGKGGILTLLLVRKMGLSEETGCFPGSHTESCVSKSQLETPSHPSLMLFHFVPLPPTGQKSEVPALYFHDSPHFRVLSLLDLIWLSQHSHWGKQDSEGSSFPFSRGGQWELVWFRSSATQLIRGIGIGTDFFQGQVLHSFPGSGASHPSSDCFSTFASGSHRGKMLG